MKIVMIADTHGFHRDPFFDDMPDGDLLIHAGDLSMMGELDVLHDVNDWFWELSKTKYNDIIVIGGNHDKSLGGKDMLAYKIFTGAHYLEESSITINDKLIYGSPQTPWNYEYIANMFAWGSLKNSITWRGIPRKTDILITHTPPYGFGDLLAEHSSDPNTHIGDKRLLDKIMEYKPELNICGHIHEGYGVREEEDTTFINCSVVDEHYNLKNEPVVINI